MKTFLFSLSLILLTALHTFAQKLSELPIVYLPDNLSIHFISPEPIQYVDISNRSITGDLPIKNILRVKYRADTATQEGVITIIGEKFMAQYHIVHSPPNGGAIKSEIDILPEAMRPITTDIGISRPELQSYSFRLLSKKPEKHLQKTNAFGIKATLNHVYTLGDYIFLDISYENTTNLKYDIDELRFTIADKKITKATNVQSLEIKPDFILFDMPSFKKYYRNIFVFKKFTYPGDKLLHIEINEKQLSGRVITLSIPYKDILDADTVPL